MDCRQNFSNFFKNKLTSVLFSDCDCSDSYFTESTFKNLNLERVILDNSTFFKTLLKGIDFSTSSIDNLVVSIPDLKGASVSYDQAAKLSQLLGVKIK
jgi:uncharacterized protein YjbI with pentapeptide repeats